MLCNGTEEVKIACHEDRACVQGAANQWTAGSIHVRAELQEDVGQHALDCDGHHLLEGGASGKAWNVNDEDHPVAIAAPATTTSGSGRQNAWVSN